MVPRHLYSLPSDRRLRLYERGDTQSADLRPIASDLVLRAWDYIFKIEGLMGQEAIQC